MSEITTPIAETLTGARSAPEILKGLRIKIYEVSVSDNSVTVDSTNLMPEYRVTNLDAGNGSIEMREIVDAASSNLQKEYEYGVEDLGKLTIAVEKVTSGSGNVSNLKRKLLQINIFLKDSEGVERNIFKQYGYLSGYTGPGSAPAKGKFTGNIEFTLTAVNGENIIS